MPEYGFSSADISSISNARTALSAGFMQLGQQIEKDITRIATLRETKAFASEMANLDPTQDNFPQQLIGTLSKYPLASQTNLAKQGIEVLGNRYATAQKSKQELSALQPFQIGNTTYDPRIKATYRLDESGNPTFLDPTPQDRTPTFRPVTTSEGVMNFNPQTGKIEGKLGDRPPPSMRATNLNVLPENVKMQIKFLDQDALAVQAERQKEIDRLGGINAETDPDDPKLIRIKQLEGQLQGIKDTRDKILSEAASATSARMGLPSGAGQGINGPSLMPAPQGNSSFVQMPNVVPNPAQMTQNTDSSAVMPDQLPVLPNVRPTVKQLSGPRLYRKVGGKMQYSGKSKEEIKKSIRQAYDDQQIGDEEADRALREAGFFPGAR